MPSLKAIRKRISTVQSTQKITRAMKMVAGARLTRAQQRILELRPYAIKTHQVLADVTKAGRGTELPPDGEETPSPSFESDSREQQLLVVRQEKRVLLVVLTSDRGLCGSFNTNINKVAEREWRTRSAQGQTVKMLVIGRKGRDYFTRRGAPLEYVPGVWDDLGWPTARRLGRQILQHFLGPAEQVDAVYFVYNEFKSAVQQQLVTERLLPVTEPEPPNETAAAAPAPDFLFEPDEQALLHQLAPMYVQVSILRALYESMASELGARMTAMEAATNNAAEMISSLTLQYNRARQAAITKELMEIIAGSEALKG
jgi:F-type H+-transporting ATPase subunit gamma